MPLYKSKPEKLSKFSSNNLLHKTWTRIRHIEFLQVRGRKILTGTVFDSKIRWKLSRIRHKARISGERSSRKDSKQINWKETYGSRYSKMDQVKFFKGCLPQIFFGSFLNTLTHMFYRSLASRVRRYDLQSCNKNSVKHLRWSVYENSQRL